MSAPAAASSSSPPTILYAQLRTARDLGYYNDTNRNNGKLGVALLEILEEAIELREEIEQPTAEQQKEIDQLQQAHERLVVHPDETEGWKILRVPAFLVIGSGIPKENYDRLIDETIRLHHLQVPQYSKPEIKPTHPGCQCKGECTAGEALPLPLDSEEGVSVYLQLLSSRHSTNLCVQLAQVEPLIDSAHLPRATLALIEEAIRLREAISPQTDELKHQIGRLKEAHHSHSARVSSFEARSHVDIPEFKTLESAIPKENYERILRDVIHKFQLRDETQAD